MDLFDLGFLTIRWLDILDIMLVSFLLYQLYNLLRGSVATNIFLGLLFIYMLWLIVKALNMQLLSGILGQFVGVGVIVVVIVFQQEIRRFLILIGKQSMIKRKNNWVKFLPWHWTLEKQEETDYQLIIDACKNLAQNKTGAIIIVSKTTALKYFANTGCEINANISTDLIETIFFKNNPLHDGAIIIAENKIKAARCILPLTERTDFPAHFGLRHRAALGLTEQSDAAAIIISEETGVVSYAERGRIKYNIELDELKKLLLSESN